MAGKSLPNGQQQLSAGAVAGAAVVAAAAGRRVVCEPGVTRLGVVLGTGLGGLADRLDDARSIPARETGWLVSSTATGHAGRVVWGSLGGRGSQGGEPSRCEVVVLQGRVHGYEGHAPESLSRGVELLAALGVTTVLLTNAAGGLRPDMQVGELMVLSDHIDLVRRPWAQGLRIRLNPWRRTGRRGLWPRHRATIQRLWLVRSRRRDQWERSPARVSTRT